MLEKLLPYFGGFALIVGAVLTWMSAGRKAGVDESGIVFEQWKTLMESHKEDMRVLKAEFAAYKTAKDTESQARNTEIEGLRKRLNDVEDKFATFRLESDERNRLLSDENQGLRRQISQVSQSSHDEIAKVAAQAEATAAHMGEVEPEARQVAAEFEDQLARIESATGKGAKP